METKSRTTVQLTELGNELIGLALQENRPILTTAGNTIIDLASLREKYLTRVAQYDYALKVLRVVEGLANIDSEYVMDAVRLLAQSALKDAP